MAIQPSWGIQYQSHLCRTAVIPLDTNIYIFFGMKGSHTNTLNHSKGKISSQLIFMPYQLTEIILEEKSFKEEKQRTPKVLKHTWTRKLAQTQRHIEFTLVKKKKRKKRKNICRDEILCRTNNSNWTFSDTNSGIKKNHNPIKTDTTI